MLRLFSKHFKDPGNPANTKSNICIWIFAQFELLGPVPKVKVIWSRIYLLFSIIIFVLTTFFFFFLVKHFGGRRYLILIFYFQNKYFSFLRIYMRNPIFGSSVYNPLSYVWLTRPLIVFKKLMNLNKNQLVLIGINLVLISYMCTGYNSWITN